jgi:MFS family permease
MPEPASDADINAPSRAIQVALLSAAMLPVMANFCIAPVLPKLLAHFSGNSGAPIYVPMLLTLPAAVGVLSSPLAGMLLDRQEKRRVLIIGAVAFGILGVLPFFLEQLQHMLWTRVLLGVAEGAIMTGVTAAVADQVRGLALKRFYARQYATMSISGSLFLGAGGLLGEFGWRQPFLLFSLALVVALLITTLPRQGAPRRETGAVPAPFPWRIALPILVAPFFGWIIYYLIPSGIPFLLREQGSYSPRAAGFAAAASLIATALSALSYPVLIRKMSALRLLALTYMVMAGGFCVISLSAHYATLVAGCALTGLGFGLLSPNVAVMLLGRVAPEVRGRAAAGISMSVMTTVFFTPLIRHYAAGIFGGTAAVFLVASVLLACAAAFVAILASRPAAAKVVISC